MKPLHSFAVDDVHLDRLDAILRAGAAGGLADEAAWGARRRRWMVAIAITLIGVAVAVAAAVSWRAH